MHVLVSTKLTQGQRKSDFNFVEDGELVILGFVCGRGAGFVDDGCGCQRSMIGVHSLTGTTTIMVADVDISAEKYLAEIIASHKRSLEESTEDGFEELLPDAKEQSSRLLAEAAGHSVGTVLEYRVGKFSVRGN